MQWGSHTQINNRYEHRGSEWLRIRSRVGIRDDNGGMWLKYIMYEWNPERLKQCGKVKYIMNIFKWK